MILHNPREYFVVNLVSVFVFFGMGSYFSATLLLALATYIGTWKLFVLFANKYPSLAREFAIAMLFVPSVVFWGSGISKDSLIYCSVGLILYHIEVLFNKKGFAPGSLIVILIAGYFALIVKAYVIVSLVPAVLLWRTLYMKEKIKSPLLRRLILPVVLIGALTAITYSLDILGKYNPAYSIDNFLETAQSMQGWHYREGENTSEQHGRGSSYTLGDYDATTWKGMLKVFPAAVNVTFFRPYLWEASGAAVVAQALESFALLIFTLYVLIKVGPIRVYSFVSGNSLVLMSLVFALFFGFAVGFSSYNFGALSRYKIPCMPFFVSALFIIHGLAKEKTGLHIMKPGSSPNGTINNKYQYKY
jgi:hypothetical protein